MAEDSNTPSRAALVLGSSAVALIVAVGSVFLKEQQDVATITRAESDHHEADKEKFDSVQSQLDRRITDIKEQFTQGRAERMAADSSLIQRMDDLNRVLAELQRQLAAIEGKLGGSVPDLNLRPLGRSK